MENTKWTFLFTGTFLFIVGLFNGFAIPFLPNSRIALSAHLAAIQGGMALLIFGAVWKHVHLNKFFSRMSVALSIYGMYATWVGLFLHATLGASQSPAQKTALQVLIYSAAIAMIPPAFSILAGLYAGRKAAIASK
ncbi:MAG: hypothetical protein ACOYXT_13600 [Bacteroidota bacterium]